MGLALVLFGALDLNRVQQALLICAATALPMILVECLLFGVHRRVSRGPVRAPDAPRVAVKLLGLYAILASIALAYWIFPLYRDPFYAPFFYVLNDVWPWLVGLAIPYFLWLDRRIPEPHDAYWHCGMVVLGRWSRVGPWQPGQLIRGWVIKGFFLPLMFVFLAHSVDYLVSAIQSGQAFDDGRWFRVLFELTFAVDLVFVCVGYTLTLRLFDSHIRSAEPTLLGWLVTIVCYQPVWGMVSGNYLAYDADGVAWRDWLAGVPILMWGWGGLILLLLCVYAWASVSFGLRFSNLTHRGIITSGPYRFTKHPAYVAKNLSWWLTAVPFAAVGSWPDAVRHCLMLLLVNALYYLRARTEERHLAQDPTYIAYALWIERHGLFRRLGQICPRLFAFRWRSAEQARTALGLT